MAAKSTPQDKEPSPEIAKDQAPEVRKAPDTPATEPQASPPAEANGAPESEPEPETRAYRVTSRSDVLLNGQLYTQGDELLLTDAVARSLLRNRCIEPEDDFK
ncbi:hypothetical protein CSV86_009540 [Pseudomonas putida CSV86]|uniref:Uncharacterized protein n=1 Tax=Pseudomonas bharatica CSV86 TaxID=1005395 RepID=L1LUG9_9PSED|nr:hypothetical protein [Pseudomonas bharatica]NNJ15458.1 hypothetical protein [Pseudomonas bharatica CSV86]